MDLSLFNSPTTPDNIQGVLQGIGNSVFHVALQNVVGIAVGVTVDTLFNMWFPLVTEPLKEEDIVGAAREGIEVAAQLMVCGLSVSLIATMLSRLDASAADPAGGAVFLMMLQWTQPVLVRRINRIANWIRLLLSKEVIPELKSTVGAPITRPHTQAEQKVPIQPANLVSIRKQARFADGL